MQKKPGKLCGCFGKFLKRQSGECYNEHENYEVLPVKEKTGVALKKEILAFPHKKGVRYGKEICPFF